MNVATILGVILIAIGIILVYIIIARSSVLSSTTPTTTTVSTSAQYFTIIPVPQPPTPVVPVKTYTANNNQISIQIPSSPFVVVVTPTQQNQIFDAYVSMTGKVDDTAVQIVPPATISSTTVLVKSSDIQDYIGYPYLVINSSAPFTVIISTPPVVTG